MGNHCRDSNCVSLRGEMIAFPRERLTTETVKGAALALERVDDVEGGDGLALGVLGVGDSVTDDTLEEGLENTTGLLVDHCSALASTHRDSRRESE
jgi:hypothetical protein